MKEILLLLGIIAVLPHALSQKLSAIGTVWADDFAEWNLYQGEEEEPVGQIRLRWQLQRDWSEWEYRIGEEIGTIRMVWKDRPEQWEINGYGPSVNIRTRWPGDQSQWVATDGDHRVMMKSLYRQDANVWYTPDESNGYLEIYTIWENDPRDWYIIDELSDNISLEMKLGLIFIPIFHSFPKN
jgi:hypothetical protein